MIDWDRVAELRNEIGEDDFAEVVEIFLEEVEEEISNLRCITDRTNLESQLHFLKGSALNLGFADFSTLCQRGESAASSGTADTIDLTEIIASYDNSKTEFLGALSSLDAA